MHRQIRKAFNIDETCVHRGCIICCQGGVRQDGSWLGTSDVFYDSSGICETCVQTHVANNFQGCNDLTEDGRLFYSFGWNCACAQTDFRPMMVIISLSNVYLMALSICRGRRCSSPASATRRHCLLLGACGWMDHLVLMCLRHHRRPHSNEQVLGQVTVHIADTMYIGTIWTKQKRAMRES